MNVLLKNIFNKNLKHFILAIFLLSIVLSCEQEVSVSPPDEPPPDGTVFIDSNPPGSHIYLNGKDRRRITPDSLLWLETNTYTITLKKELFRDTSVTVQVTEGEKSFYYVDYTKNPYMKGKIVCDAKPIGSQIILNGVNTGLITPATISDLMPGYYTVRYKLENHRDDSVVVTVSSKTTVEAKTTLVDTTIWTDLTTSTSSIPTNNLTCMLIDENDVLWIGTEEKGLLKYDGNSWITYSPANSLMQDYRVSSICFDSEGVLWVGNKLGVFLIGSNFTEKYNNIGSKPFTDPDVKSIAAFNDNNIHIATSVTTVFSSLNFWGYRDWVLRTRTDYGISSDNFTSAAIDRVGNTYTGTNQSGLIIGESKPINTSNSQILANKIGALTADPAAGIWIGYKSGLGASTGFSYYNGTFNNFTNILKTGLSTNTIYIDNEYIKWIGTNRGLYRFIGGVDFQSYTEESTGLKMNDVRGFAKDSKGRIWIATFGGGLIVKKK
jgi:hypothetical protein